MLFCSNKRICSAGSVFLSPLFCASRAALQQAISASSDLWTARGDADLNLSTSTPLWLLWTWEVVHRGNNHRLKSTAQQNCWGSPKSRKIGESIWHHFLLLFFYFILFLTQDNKIRIDYGEQSNRTKMKTWAKTSSLQFLNWQHWTNYWDRASHLLYVWVGYPQRR